MKKHKLSFVLMCCVAIAEFTFPQLSYSQLQDDCDTQPCLRVHFDEALLTTWAGSHSLENQPLNMNWHNTAYGHNSMRNIIGTPDPVTGLAMTGFKHTAIGALALAGLPSGVNGGIYNTALGAAALRSIDDGHFNTAVGASAMSRNTKGFFNVSVGLEALRGDGNSWQTGNYNTALGTYGLWKNTTGSRNTALGTFAGLAGSNPGDWFGYEPHATDPIRGGDNLTGNDNIFIGYKSGPSTTNLNSSIAIGTDAIVTADNQLVIGSNYSDSSRGLITNSYWGSGVTSDDPKDFKFNATGGSGDDMSGADLILAGGKSTGLGEGGSIRFQTSPKGTAGTNLNEPVDRMVIDYKGNIGMGTSSPLSALHIQNNNPGTYLLIQNTRAAGERGIHFAGAIIDANNDPYIWIDSSSPQTLRFWSAGSDRMIIANSGNVGIGTTNPQSKLSVTGLPNTPPDSSGTKGIVCITNDGNMWIDDDGDINICE